MHLAFKQWERTRFEALVRSIDPQKHAILHEACPLVLRLARNTKSRKGLELTKICTLILKQSLKRSKEGLALSSTRITEFQPSRIADVVTVGIGLCCVVDLYRILGPRRSRISGTIGRRKVIGGNDAWKAQAEGL